MITLDDGTNTNLLKGAATEVPYAYLANGAPARVGYHVTFSAPVVLEPRHGSWVFQPTSLVAGHPDRAPVTIIGERPSAPAVGGDTRVATFNVLNYFSDLGVDEAGCAGYPDRTGAFVTAKKCKVRGAFSREAFANQEAKIVSAINALGVDVVALEEIENPVAVGVGTDRDASLARLVEALNKAAGAETWAYVPSPKTVPADEDVIRVAFIYKTATVTPVGPSLIHDDPAFRGLARQPLAQEFARRSGERAAAPSFVVIANHFKSKGSVPEARARAIPIVGTDRGTRTRSVSPRPLRSLPSPLNSLTNPPCSSATLTPTPRRILLRPWRVQGGSACPAGVRRPTCTRAAPVPSITCLPMPPRSLSWRVSPAGPSTPRNPSLSNTRARA